jgi:hypothetical protein
MSAHHSFAVPIPLMIPVQRDVADWRFHTNEDMANAHAKEIEKMTGDHCEVKIKNCVYKIARFDAGGKRVS